MSLKKNAVSYMIWMIMLLFTGAVVAFMGMIIAQSLAGNNIFAAAGFVAGFFVILFLIYFLTGFLVSRCRFADEGIWSRINSSMFVEGLIIGLCISASVAVRIFLLPTAGEDAEYFNLAKVTEQGSVLVQSVQKSVYYYCLLLHGLLRIFGNHWIVGIWLQIVLQAVSSIFFYFAIRRLVGKGPAMLLLLFLGFAPLSIDAGLTYSPQMLYLCIFSLIFLLVSDYLHRSKGEEEYPVWMWLYTALSGIAIGFLCYVDITGVLLLLLAGYCIGMMKRNSGSAWFWLLRFLLLALCVAAAFGGMLLLDSFLSGTTFIGAWNAWFVNYNTIELNMGIFTEERELEIFVLPMLSAIGIFSFWRRKKSERFTHCILLVLGMSMLYFAGITADNMDGSYLLYVLLATLAGIAVLELFYREMEPVEVSMEEVEMQETVAEESIKKELPTEAVEEKVEKVDLEKKEQPKAETNMIENPLPVPKKKARKGMDYAFIPKPSQMMYDIRVSDTDDFDI